MNLFPIAESEMQNTQPLQSVSSRMEQCRQLFSDPSQSHCARVGMLTQLSVERALLERGCHVFRPVMEGTEIDLIVLSPSGRFWRVQVKTAHKFFTPKGAGPYIQFAVGRGAFRNGKRKPYTAVDVFIAVCEGSFWIVPKSSVKAKARTGLKWQCPFFEDWHFMGLNDEA